MEPQETQESLQELNESVTRIKAEMSKIIVGQSEMIDLLIVSLLADGHVLLEGVPGVAKTLTAKLVARTLSVGFSRIQFTPDLMPSDVLGTSIFNMKSSEFEFKKGPVFSNFVLIDEINRAPAKTQAALFEVMEERQVTMEGTTYVMEPPFLVIATQNPVEQEGTYRLPEAQLDRFMFKVEVGYPSAEEELNLLTSFHEQQDRVPIEAVKPVLTVEGLIKLRERVRQVHVEPSVLEYISQIVVQTRGHQGLFLGASPRASLAILSGAKAFAAMQGRTFVTPEDVKYISLPVLRHRVVMTPELEMEGTQIDQLIRDMVNGVEVPR